MADPAPRLVIVIRPGPDRRRLLQLRSWLHALVPAAALLVAPAKLPELPSAEVVQLDCCDGLDGPLSVASALASRLGR